MKLKDLHVGAEAYLLEEGDYICGMNRYGIFVHYSLKPDTECILLAEGKELISAVVGNQIVILKKSQDDNAIVDVYMYDATKNNLEIVYNACFGRVEKSKKLDAFRNKSNTIDNGEILDIIKRLNAGKK